MSLSASTVQAHGFEGFLFKFVTIPPQFVEDPNDSPGSPPIMVQNLNFQIWMRRAWTFF